jgi:hypothetical protein
MSQPINAADLESLIRMAQVLKMRAGFLADDLVQAKRGNLAGSARRASSLAHDTEKKLNSILTAILTR